MMSRLAPLWLLAGLLIGYAVSGAPARADDTPRLLPAGIGQGSKVTLTFQWGTLSSGGYSIPCTIAQTYGTWIRCAPADDLSAPQGQRWFDLSRVTEIDRAER